VNKKVIKNYAMLDKYAFTWFCFKSGSFELLGIGKSIIKRIILFNQYLN
jgi:hypothetical protein